MSLEIGLRLKEARESLGLTIQDIRDKTRIETGYLIALENGEFDKLPSPYFVRTCIRQYAKCVGIEPHHLLKKYRPIPGESGSHDAVKKRNTDRQKAVQDRSRFTATHPRISPRGESADTHDEEGGRRGSRSFTQRTMRLESLSQKTDPEAGFVSGDTGPLDEERESRYRYPMERSSLSRRAERAQEGESSRKIRRIGMVAGIVLLIPAAAWGAYAFLKDDPPAETPSAQQQQSEPKNVNAEPPSPSESDSLEGEGEEAGVTLVEKSGGVAHYQVAATDELSVEIGPVSDVCWVQIREQAEGGKYLKDVTLRNNETYKYKHPADGSSNLYIEFGAPQAVKQIKVNGQPIEASKVIRIERSE